MRILLIGATGTIGQAITAAFGTRHDVIPASRHKARESVDVGDPDSIRALLKRVGRVDAIVSAAGQAAFKPLGELSDADFAFSVGNKLMGQVNLVRFGLASVADNGSVTLTSGVLAQQPMPGSAAISLVNAGLEGFTRAAALEAPRNSGECGQSAVGDGNGSGDGLAARFPGLCRPAVVARSYVEVSRENDRSGPLPK